MGLQEQLSALMEEYTDLQAELEELKKYARHTSECASLKRHYDPHCPLCNGIRGYWVTGVGFENDRMCTSCMKSWEPKDVFPPCDCGFDQALKAGES